MAIMPKQSGTSFEVDTIVLLQTTGRHVLASGRVATVLTDERFSAGDAVYIVNAGSGNWVIIGGVK